MTACLDALHHGPTFTLALAVLQALAVFELLDDLRELIWSHYLQPIQDIIRRSMNQRRQSLRLIRYTYPQPGTHLSCFHFHP